MATVPITELRQNLATYLARVKAGETLRIVVHGEVVARLEPEVPSRDAAIARLAELRKAGPVGDVSSRVPMRWSAQHDEWAMNPPARKATKKSAKRQSRKQGRGTAR